MLPTAERRIGEGTREFPRLAMGMWLRDGVVLGLRDRIADDLGTFFPQQGLMPMYVTAKHLPGPYTIPHYRVEGRGVANKKTSCFAYRGFGKEAANMMYERLMDLIARRLRLDPAEVRFRNFIQPQDFPYPSPSGSVSDGGHRLLGASDVGPRRGGLRVLSPSDRALSNLSSRLRPDGAPPG